MTESEIMDQYVFEAIYGGHSRFSDICSFCIHHGVIESQAEFRKVDRALQRLRKNGEISFTRDRGWEMEQ